MEGELCLSLRGEFGIEGRVVGPQAPTGASNQGARTLLLLLLLLLLLTPPWQARAKVYESPSYTYSMLNHTPMGPEFVREGTSSHEGVLMLTVLVMLVMLDRQELRCQSGHGPRVEAQASDDPPRAREDLRGEAQPDMRCVLQTCTGLGLDLVLLK